MDSTASSPFSPHFNTNYIPSDSEIYEIRDIIHSHQVVIDGIEKQIRELEDRRRLHTTVVEQHLPLLSPIKRMPTYILSLIFLTCLPNRHFLASKSRDPAVIISHVCRQWRTIALDTPLLWSKIHIHVPYISHPRHTVFNRLSMTEGSIALYQRELAHHERNIQLIQDMAAEWIRRSAHCPLDIAVFCADNTFESNPFISRHVGDWQSGQLFVGDFPQARLTSVAPLLVDLLLSVASRWERISLDLMIDSPASSLLRLLEALPRDLSQLKDLRIMLSLPSPRVEGSWVLREGLVARASLLKAPHLRSLVLGRVWMPKDMLPVNWYALTELCLGYGPDRDHGGFSASNVLRILKACPNLIRCIVTLNSHSADQPPPFPQDGKISLPHLVSLTIQGTSLPPDFASFFNLPSLRTLSVLCHSTTPEDEEHSRFIGWVHHFGEILTEVSFEPSALTPPALIYALERLPNVVTLRMVDSGTVGYDDWDRGASRSRAAVVSDSVLAKLTPQPDSDVDGLAGSSGGHLILPRLQNFSCRMVEIEFTEKGLLEFIVGRRQSSTSFSSLKRVVVKFNMPQTTNIMDELEDRGVDLEGFSAFIRYHENGSGPFPLSDACLEDFTPEDRMVASSIWTPPGAAEWWWL